MLKNGKIWSYLIGIGAICFADLALGECALFPSATLAQLIPDNTLGAESSLVNKLNELNERIDGGAT